MAVGGNLVVRLGANINNFVRNMKKAETRVSRFAKRVRAGAAAFKGYGLAAAAVAVGFVIMFKAIANATDRIAKLAERVNISIERLSAWKLVVGLAGSSLEVFAKSQQTLARAMSDAQRGLLTYQRAFDDLGISIVDQFGRLKDTEVVFLEMADAVQKLGRSTKTTAVLQEVLGRGGKELANAMLQGSAAIEEQIERTKRLGIAFGPELAQKAVEFNDALLTLVETIKALIRDALLPFAPAITRFVDDLIEAAEFAEAAGIPRYEALGRKLGEKIMDGMISALNPVNLAKALFELTKFQTERMVVFGVEKIFGEARARQIEFDRLLSGKTVFQQKNLKDLRFSKLTTEFDAFQAMVKQSVKQVVDLTAPMKVNQKLAEAHAAAWRSARGPIKDIGKEFEKQQSVMEKSLKKFKELQISTFGGPQAVAVIGISKQFTDFQRDLVATKQITKKELLELQTAMIKGLNTTTQAAKENFDAMNTFAVQAAANMEDAFATLFFDAMTGRFSGFMGLLQQVEDAVAKLVANMIAQDLAGALFGKNFGSTGKAGGAIGGIINALGLGGFGGLFGGGFKKITPATTGYIGQGTFGLGLGSQIRPFQHGGIVTKPTLSLLGEAGPEVVVPLHKTNRFRQDRRGGDVFNFNINAMDSQSFEQFAGENFNVFVDVIAAARENNHPMQRTR